MTLHQLTAKIALSLPEVSCSQPFGEGCDVYKVMDKVFLLNSQVQATPISNLKVMPDHGDMLRDLYAYIHTGWHMNKRHWISIYEQLDTNLDTDLIIDLVENSYQLVVSKLNKTHRQRIELLRTLKQSDWNFSS